MLYFSTLLITCTAAYCLLLWYYLHHWDALEDPIGRSPQTPPVTIVVPARNEETNIVRCLETILEQDYRGQVECIVVDDHSDDDTVAHIRASFGERVTIISLLGTKAEGKKHALLAGIEAASGEIVLTTDADCVVPHSWIRTVVSTFTEKVQIVTGPVIHHRPTTLFGRLQVMDIAVLMVITGAGIRSRLHHLANGANLAFRKSAYEEVGGYDGNMQLASGDDVFLMQKIAREHPGGIRFLKTQAALVRTSPERSLVGFIRQRVRWASKNNALPERLISHIWAFVWLLHMLILGGFVAAFFYPQWVLVPLGCLLLKMVMDGRLVYAGLRFSSMEKLFWYYPSVILLHFVYVLLMGWFAVFGKGFVWKGRRVG